MMTTTPANAIRLAHERALDMRSSVQQRAQEIQAERETQRATEAAKDAGTGAQ